MHGFFRPATVAASTLMSIAAVAALAAPAAQAQQAPAAPPAAQQKAPAAVIVIVDMERVFVQSAAGKQAQAEIHRGAMLSLAARVRFWSGVQDKIVRWRQPRNVHLRTPSRRD